MGERCGLCRFWPQYPYAEVNNIPDAGDAGNGQSDCRRYAPKAFHEATRGDYPSPMEVVSRWPRTRSGDWCGEFEPRPESKSEGG